MSIATSPFADSRLVDTRYFTRIGTVAGIVRSDRGLLASVDSEQLRVDVIRDDIIRLKISRGGIFDETPTFAVCADLQTAHADFTIEENDEWVRLRTARMTLTLWRTPFRLEAHRADGSVLFETHSDQDGKPWGYATLNDAFVVGRRCQRGDGFFGLGEKGGRLNRKGQEYTLWNNDVLDPNSARRFAAGLPADDPRADRTSVEFDPYYVSIPFFYHLSEDGGAAAGFFLDNGYRGHFDFAPQTHYSFHFEGGQYTEYLFAGPSMREILEGYTWLTGRMLPPPLWALGYHQCRWHRYTQETIERLAARLREAKLPCDALWLDIEYMDGYRVFTWDEAAFPDVPAMLASLQAQGFRTITIVDPGVKYEPGYSIFDQAVERDVLCKTEGGDLYVGQVWPGKTAFPDFVLESAREWWGELNAAHVQSGLAGIWNDMNEPATGDVLPDTMRFGNGQFSHARYHNQYALLMAMGTLEGLQRAMPDKRTFILSRAGSAGIQRYAANWMGDNQARWDHLWVSMPMAMGYGLSGQPFLGADIGGFQGNSNAELFARWMQYGALTPFCRNHSELDNVDQYAWAFGEAIEELSRQALQLRYRLLPYLYAAFMQSAQSGEPIQKPLLFEFQADRTLRDIDDQFLLGSHLLVAPVYAAGVTARPLYLPEGTWYHWHTGERFVGKRFIVAPTPMDWIPLFARGGAVIPLWPEAPLTTMGYQPQRIELHLFVPEADGEYHSFLHEDDGLTFAFRDGAYLRTDLTLRKEGPRLTLEASVSGEGYPEFARREFEIVFHGASPQTITLDGHPLSQQDGRWLLSNSGSGFRLELA